MCNYSSFYENNDKIKKYIKVFVLKTKLTHEPGTHSQYSDAAYYLLSRVIYELSGKDVSDLLRPILMETMKFKEFAWSKCPYGYSIGATGLYVRTEDMVKLGILFLNKGMWKEERIVSEEWISLVIENGYEFHHIKDGWYAKGDMLGQFLMFNIEKGLAIGCHSYDDNVRASMFLI